MFWTLHQTASRMVLCALFGVVGPACGKKAPTAPVAQQETLIAPKQTPQSKARLDAELLAALAPTPAEAATVGGTDLTKEAELVMAKYPEKNAQDLLNVPEVNPKLAEALKGLAADPQLQAAINKSVDLAAYFKGLSGPPGAFKLNLDVKVYDRARTQRMLTSVLSGKPKPVVQFLVDELGEASFEFGFTENNKTQNGISIEPNPNPPAAAPADPD
jgi:type VI protein secretion system component VasK